MDVTGLDLRATLKANLHRLKPNDRTFAESLLSKTGKQRTEKVVHWIGVLAQRATAETPEAAPPAKIQGAGLDRIKVLFERALQYVKHPKITLDGFTLSPAPATGKNPGAIYVKSEGGTYLGKITPESEWRPIASAETEVPGVGAALRALASNPAEAAAAYGKRTGNCCFCRLPLTDGRSVAVGYGPTCAKNYDLPWGEDSVAPTVLVA